MLDLKNYRPKETFFWFRLNRRCCILRLATGYEDLEEVVIIANAWCLVDTWEQRVTPTEVHVFPSAMQTFNIYIPRRWVHTTTGEEVTIPLGYEEGWYKSGIKGPAPQDIAIVTGVPQPLHIVAVHVPLLLGSHMEIMCQTDPRMGLTSNIPDPTDPWYGLLKPEALEDMLPYVRTLLPHLLQL